MPLVQVEQHLAVGVGGEVLFDAGLVSLQVIRQRHVVVNFPVDRESRVTFGVGDGLGPYIDQMGKLWPLWPAWRTCN